MSWDKPVLLTKYWFKRYGKASWRFGKLVNLARGWSYPRKGLLPKGATRLVFLAATLEAVKVYSKTGGTLMALGVW